MLFLIRIKNRRFVNIDEIVDHCRGWRPQQPNLVPECSTIFINADTPYTTILEEMQSTDILVRPSFPHIIITCIFFYMSFWRSRRQKGGGGGGGRWKTSTFGRLHPVLVLERDQGTFEGALFARMMALRRSGPSTWLLAIGQVYTNRTSHAKVQQPLSMCQ